MNDLTVTFGPHSKSKTWRTKRVSWPDIVAMLREHAEGKKDGPGVIFGALESDGPRTNARVTERSAIALDLDDGTPMDTLKRTLEARGWACAVYSTHSHAPGHPKWRVVIPLAQPARREDFDSQSAFQDHWRKLNEAVAADLGFEIDESCKDLARLVYLPRHPKGAAEHRAGALEGEFLDPASVKPVEVKPEAPKPEKESTYEPDPLSKLGDRYSAQCGPDELVSMLLGHGWKLEGMDAENFKLTRPGKGEGTSGTVKRSGQALFYCFTSSAEPFEAGEAYSPFQVLAFLEHGGDFSAAARALAGREGTEPAKPRKRRSAFSLAMVDEVLARPMEEEWLVDSVIPLRGLSMIYGDPKAGKTFLALDVACHVVLGLPWRKSRQTMQGPVVYICGEGHRGIRKRLEAWSRYHGVELKGAPLAVSGMAAAFSDPDSVEEVRKAVDDASRQWGRRPVAVIIDTLARNIGAADENSSRDMSMFIDGLDEALGNDCARLVIHHSGHGTSARARGSSALPGAVDAAFKVERSATGLTSLGCTLMKDSACPPTMHFQSHTVEVWSGEINGTFKVIESLALEALEGVVAGPKIPAGKKADLLRAIAAEAEINVPLHIDSLTAHASAFFKKPKRALEELAAVGWLHLDDREGSLLFPVM